jgi:hypothetical protein
MYPSRGVVLTYGGGESVFCPANAPRTFSVEVVCAPFVAKSRDDYDLVTCRESNTCSYSVQLPNIAGCPTQCRAPADGVLCGRSLRSEWGRQGRGGERRRRGGAARREER